MEETKEIENLTLLIKLKKFRMDQASSSNESKELQEYTNLKRHLYLLTK